MATGGVFLIGGAFPALAGLAVLGAGTLGPVGLGALLALATLGAF